MGKWAYDYWFHVQGAPMTDHELVREALVRNNPCYAMQTTRHGGELPAAGMRFFAVDNPAFAITSVTAEEQKNVLFIRGWNASDEDLTAALTLCKSAAKVTKVDLEGNVLEALLEDAQGGFTFTAGKREIVTLRVEWRP